MRAMMFSGVLLAASLHLGCATVGGGWDTAKFKLGSDCKAHAIDNTIPGLPKDAVMPSPNATVNGVPLAARPSEAV
jgi:hypothetical protein